MSYTIADGRFPKKPGYGNILEACRKDFRDFKEDNESRVIEHFRSQIGGFAHLDTPNNVLIKKNENLEIVRRLINEGKENIAFSVFFRTFPSCLPHRARNL
jgi:hypothetical protein